ncbi:MAG: hypothetical protein A3H31_07985 [Gallionellales bacterium RIFCSPLOWO2_02_FULL_57_47]|nr:MAG: hypothetical protein A3H31_07985 [Gallionellales bacterium RIFCSPLOWO2_02_FULL_57_47]OGT15951.1 MAG: hypothetical protein A3J49_07610 [Gallionellales bacterium RIFCSPHIGHO2_02_FULL_57_16]
MRTQEHCFTGVTAAAPWRVRAVSVQPSYRLSITCTDGTSGIVDMSALVKSSNAGIFAALQDVQLFQQISIELGALTWPNGADLDPVWVHEEIGKNKTWPVPV